MASSSYRDLLATVKAELVGAKGAPQHRTELFQALDFFLPHFQSFLVFPGPRAHDRAQVSNSPSTLLENQDIQIVLRLSDDFNLNEVYCAGLVISSLEKGNLHDRGQLEILRISAGLWFIERDSLITSLLLLLHAVALDKELDSEFIGKLQPYIEKFLDAGLRIRLMSLIKELDVEGATVVGCHGSEPYIKDSTGLLVERFAAIQKTRLSLCHCLYLSCLIAPLNAQDLKDLYNLLKLCSGDGTLPHDVIKLRITYTIMFTLSNALVSGAQGPEERGFMLALDVGFLRDFQQLIMDDSEFNAITEGFTGIIRLAWVIFRTSTQQVSELTANGATVEDDGILCLNRACDHDVFGFLSTQVFGTAAFQNDERVSAFKYTTSLSKLILSLLSLPAGRQKIMELKYKSMMALNIQINHLKDTVLCYNGQAQNQAVKLQAQPLVSFLCFVREIFQRGPELVINNNDLWSFVYFAGDRHTSYFTLVSFLDMLTALAVCKEGAGRVYDLLQRPTISNLGWKNLFTSLVVYDEKLRLCMDTAKTCLPTFQEGDTRVVEAYLKVMEKVIENGDALERMQWFEDIEPLFKLLSRENVPPFLKGALRNAIAACSSVSSVMKEKVCSLLEQYDLPVLATSLKTDGSGQHLTKQFYDLTYEFNEVEAREKEYLSTLSYLKLRNVLTAHELDTRGGRYFEIFQFVRDQVFGLYSQRLYAKPAEKWELVVAALHHFEILLSNYETTKEDVKSKSDNVIASVHSLPAIATTCSAAIDSSATPVIELMKDLKDGKVIYSNLMSILMLGVKFVLEQRVSQLYGPILEEAVSVSFQIFIHAFLKEALFAEAFYPSHQPLHVIICQNSHQVATLLEYVRYDKSQLIPRFSVKVMELLSARVPNLVFVLQEAEAIPNLTEGYAACLEARILEAHPPENLDEDIGSLILRVLLANLCQPPPNLTHLLLGFDINQAVEKTTLQPNRHFSCLTVLLRALDTLARPEVNAELHELGFKLLYELCVDPVTCGPMVDLLRNGKYDFLPKRTPHTSHDTCLERGNSSISGTDPCSSEAHDLELLTCDFEPAAGSAPETPSNSRPEVGFLNPEPLATRCTTKENDGLGEGSVSALRSSWIQRLFPGMLGESVKPSQWKEKEKHLAPDHEGSERLLIENATKSAQVEEFGTCPQLLGEGPEQGRERRHCDGKPGRREEDSSMDLVPPCSNTSHPLPGIPKVGLSLARESYRASRGLASENRGKSAMSTGHLSERSQDRVGIGSQQAGVDNSLTSTRFTKEQLCMRPPLGYSKLQNLHSYADVDSVSMHGVHRPAQRHSVSMCKVGSSAQQQEHNRIILNASATSYKPAVLRETPLLQLRKSELQSGSTRNGSYSPTGRAVRGEDPRVASLNINENVGHQPQYHIDKGKNAGSLGSCPLPPLSLFAPLKPCNEQRTAEFEGKTKMAPGSSEASLMTPLFSSRGHKDEANDRQGGGGGTEERFDSTVFAPYKALSSLQHSTRVGGFEIPLTLTPIFAPFKSAKEQQGPSTSVIKADSLPLDLMEQDGEDEVEKDIGMNLDELVKAKDEQVDHQGQLCNQFTAHGRTSSVYSSSPRPGVADQREGAMFLQKSGECFNGVQDQVGVSDIHGPTLKAGNHTVNTTAIELSSRRPSLHEEQTDDRGRCKTNNVLFKPQSHHVLPSASRGDEMHDIMFLHSHLDIDFVYGGFVRRRDNCQIDQDLQRVNAGAGTMRELRLSGNLVCEVSSGSSPVPGCGLPCQQDGLKGEAASSSGVKGKNMIDGPSVMGKVPEREQVNANEETRGGITYLNGMAQSSEIPLLRRKLIPTMEGHGLRQGKSLFGEPEDGKLSMNAQEEKLGRSSRKRSHDARTSDSHSVFQNSESPVSLAVPQNQVNVEDACRTTPRAQSWLQRWMPSSKPSATVFKAPQSCRSMPPGQPLSCAKNRRVAEEGIVEGQRLDAVGSDVQEQRKAPEMEKGGTLPGSNSEHHHRRSSSLFPVSIPVPSAAAMALVGAASKRAAPLAPQRVGTRIAVWPAIAGIQLRRTDQSGTPGVEVEMVVEEG